MSVGLGHCWAVSSRSLLAAFKYTITSFSERRHDICSNWFLQYVKLILSPKDMLFCYLDVVERIEVTQ